MSSKSRYQIRDCEAIMELIYKLMIMGASQRAWLVQQNKIESKWLEADQCDIPIYKHRHNPIIKAPFIKDQTQR